jgi:hypothetical protein
MKKAEKRRLDGMRVGVGERAYKGGKDDYSGKFGTIYTCDCCGIYRVQFDGIANNEKLVNFKRGRISIFIPSPSHL